MKFSLYFNWLFYYFCSIKIWKHVPKKVLPKLQMMATRFPANQTLHDRVVQTAYNNLNKTAHDVYVNNGGMRITSVYGEYPDIIITPKGSNSVQWIIEIETVDSITDTEASQWKVYSNLGGIFYILVPRQSRILVETICLKHGIKARYGTYQIDNWGGISNIIYE